ncbi:hypothetical protein [Streptomyces roseochromogenus]|uniref:Uncharacterized protein n=1 Tax=Streptomyces roseochromogenus subsp. oscitans DS 12.976 TaxID=1352936 RepID=V6JPV1_STRRC|nr:hypothetical protein [Streptomyces roseochromogenus]EST18879.1 hypothetical protein M878_43985 [Streptomyces roseochromogenus subsp. oscitans DS 12.976]
MDTQGAHGHRHRQRGRAGGGPKFRRRREHGSWRLTADGLEHEAALVVLRKRRPSVGAWPACRVGSGGSIALNAPGRNQSAKFRGRLDVVPDPDGGGGALVVSGAMLETMNGIMLAPLFGFVTLVTLGIFLLGALTVTIPPLVIGLVATPLMAALTVFFARGRGRAYDLDADRLYRDLHKLLAPMRPEPLGDSRRLDRS